MKIFYLIITLVFIVGLGGSQAYAGLVHTLGGTQGSGNGQLDQPWGLAVNSTGHVFVAEYWNQRISIFDSDGNFKKKFVDPGLRLGQCTRASNSMVITNGDICTANGELNQPQDVEFDSSGNVYVLDMGNNRVQKFDKNGIFLSKFGTACTLNENTGLPTTDANGLACNSNASGAVASGDGQFYSPHDIAIDSSNNIYVVDMNNYRIQKFDSSGNFLLKFGSKGCQVIQNDSTITGETHNGKFCSPQSIAVDASNNLYITDSNNRRIQKFDSSGNFISQFGGYGNTDGKFINPHYIELDSSKNIYVGDRERNNVQVFGPDFQFKYVITGFSDPKDIVIDPLGRLNVAYNHGVKVFDKTAKVLENGQTTLTFSSDYYEVILNSTNFSSLTQITVSSSNSHANLNFTKILQNDGGGTKSITFSNEITTTASTSDGDIILVIPTGSKVSGSNWAGLFKIANSANKTGISVSGQTVNLATTFGSESTLSFSKPVKINMVSKSDQNVGYVSGGTPTLITTTCQSNDLTTVTAQLGGSGECKIKNANDMVIWTYHFTTFFSSSSNSVSSNPSSSTGESGGHGRTGLDVSEESRASIVKTKSEVFNPIIYRWADGMITDSDMLKVIKTKGTSSESIPKWMKQNANWVKSGEITSEQFIRALDYLYGKQIFK